MAGAVLSPVRLASCCYFARHLLCSTEHFPASSSVKVRGGENPASNYTDGNSTALVIIAVILITFPENVFWVASFSPILTKKNTFEFFSHSLFSVWILIWRENNIMHHFYGDNGSSSSSGQLPCDGFIILHWSTKEVISYCEIFYSITSWNFRVLMKTQPNNFYTKNTLKTY